MTEDDFVAAVTEGQPVRPAYFSFDAQRTGKPINFSMSIRHPRRWTSPQWSLATGGRLAPGH